MQAVRCCAAVHKGSAARTLVPMSQLRMSGCAWEQLRTAAAAHGSSRAWQRLGLAAAVHGSDCAWQRLRMAVAAHGSGCAWQQLRMAAPWAHGCRCTVMVNVVLGEGPPPLFARGAEAPSAMLLHCRDASRRAAGAAPGTGGGARSRRWN
jgi:hypothetical protein